ncbi:hypothetical protein Acid345_4770 [Candidatus Koribacter versatilis Ellin345]|uniref:YggT family protein n=1 Tax=Koribacter versatilis (strain Ellin345) TaxID=204669 RepID=Q1IH81_KORVE|nr:hypothetical protein [Candidatus Koribacter versatilis]ABF43769.1 hypothetical protein Acid345_4770 [Candidatus Koribacter versatilis Ellin345]
MRERYDFHTMIYIELFRLLLGLLIAYFHKPIADFMMERERATVILFRQRGFPLPQAPTTEQARTLYFLIGIAVASIELIRMYLLQRGIVF